MNLPSGILTKTQAATNAPGKKKIAEIMGFKAIA